MASIATRHPCRSHSAQSCGIAVISLDLSSTFSCPRTSRCVLAHALTLWMAALEAARSKERRSVLPSTATISPTALTERVGPGEKTVHAFVRIEASAHAAKRIVRRNAMGHIQHLLEPLGLRLALCFH